MYSLSVTSSIECSYPGTSLLPGSFFYLVCNCGKGYSDLRRRRIQHGPDATTSGPYRLLRHRDLLALRAYAVCTSYLTFATSHMWVTIRVTVTLCLGNTLRSLKVCAAQSENLRLAQHRLPIAASQGTVLVTSLQSIIAHAVVISTADGDTDVYILSLHDWLSMMVDQLLVWNSGLGVRAV